MNGSGDIMSGSGMNTELKKSAFRIMDALSGVDEILLERCEKRSKIIDYNSHKRDAGRRRGLSGRSGVFGRRLSGTWAAVLCLAVVGGMSWGGYRLTRGVDWKSGQNSAEDSVGALPMQSVTIAQEPDGAGNAGEGAQEGGSAGGAGLWNGTAQDLQGEPRADGGNNSSAGGEGVGAGSADSPSGDGDVQESLPTEEREATRESQKLYEGTGEDAEGQLDKSQNCVASPYEEISTEAEARAVKGLGIYIPTALPGGYVFESALRSPETENQKVLRVNWRRGMDYIEVVVTAESSAPDTVDVSRPETYDERLYEIPYGTSVPAQYLESILNPVFSLEDFSLEIVESRMISHSDSGDTDTPRGNFAVLYPDGVVVRFTGRGTAQEIWDLFESIRPAGADT